MFWFCYSETYGLSAVCVWGHLRRRTRGRLCVHESALDGLLWSLRVSRNGGEKYCRTIWYNRKLDFLLSSTYEEESCCPCCHSWLHLILYHMCTIGMFLSLTSASWSYFCANWRRSDERCCWVQHAGAGNAFSGTFPGLYYAMNWITRGRCTRHYRQWLEIIFRAQIPTEMLWRTGMASCSKDVYILPKGVALGASTPTLRVQRFFLSNYVVRLLK